MYGRKKLNESEKIGAFRMLRTFFFWFKIDDLSLNFRLCFISGKRYPLYILTTSNYALLNVPLAIHYLGYVLTDVGLCLKFSFDIVSMFSSFNKWIFSRWIFRRVVSNRIGKDSTWSCVSVVLDGANDGDDDR